MLMKKYYVKLYALINVFNKTIGRELMIHI